MARSEAYAAFAWAYDKALGERFARAAQRMLRKALDEHPTERRTHLDLACGTGLATDFFRRRGFATAGVDGSVEMLQLARGRGARVAAGDLRALPLRGPFARITCLYDSLNHLLEPEELAAAFREIARLMDDDSLLLFDVNHPDVYRAVWGTAEPYVASGADYHLEIATSYRPRQRIGQALVTGWAELPRGGGRERVAIRETHRQRAYEEWEIVHTLAAAGLEPLAIRDFDPYGEREAIEAEGVKLFFVVRRA